MMKSYIVVTEDYGLGKRVWEVKANDKGKVTGKPKLLLQRPKNGALKEMQVFNWVEVKIYSIIDENVRVLLREMIVEDGTSFERMITLAEGK